MGGDYETFHAQVGREAAEKVMETYGPKTPWVICFVI
jgi:hypothetical protein